MTGAEIIKVDLTTKIGKTADVARNHVVGGCGHNGFQNFNSQPIGRQVELVQLPLDLS